MQIILQSGVVAALVLTIFLPPSEAYADELLPNVVVCEPSETDTDPQPFITLGPPVSQLPQTVEVDERWVNVSGLTDFQEMYSNQGKALNGSCFLLQDSRCQAAAMFQIKAIEKGWGSAQVQRLKTSSGQEYFYVSPDLKEGVESVSAGHAVKAGLLLPVITMIGGLSWYFGGPVLGVEAIAASFLFYGLYIVNHVFRQCSQALPAAINEV